jgi:hypothetical protein
VLPGRIELTTSPLPKGKPSVTNTLTLLASYDAGKRASGSFPQALSGRALFHARAKKKSAALAPTVPHVSQKRRSGGLFLFSRDVGHAAIAALVDSVLLP